jgi:hypothetical protein
MAESRYRTYPLENDDRKRSADFHFYKKKSDDPLYAGLIMTDVPSWDSDSLEAAQAYVRLPAAPAEDNSDSEESSEESSSDVAFDPGEARKKLF